MLIVLPRRERDTEGKETPERRAADCRGRDRDSTRASRVRVLPSLTRPATWLSSSSVLSTRSLPSHIMSERKMRGAFIVIEGLDRSGKSTQVALLEERLKSEGIPVRLLKFPGE